MQKVAILTDGTCCLPADIVREYDIAAVPIVIMHQGKSYRDGVDITPDQVYRIMRQRNDLPTTSTPSVGDFMQAFQTLSERAAGILCITLTGLQSQIYEVARLAKEAALKELPDTSIEVLDSRAVAGALGLIVLEAAREARRGSGLAQVTETARKMMDRVRFVAMVDTLYYLARTGRVARAAAWVGSLLNIKPVLEHVPQVGETAPLARPRTREKAIGIMLDYMASHTGARKAHIIVNHADEPDEARKLVEKVSNMFDCAEVHMADLTPGMGVHAGPGVLGIGFWAE
jgi:DegV family protein with EDD domain